MKQILIAIIVAVLLVGCAKNDLKSVNGGTNEWQQIQIKAGGHDFKIERLEGGASQAFQFLSKAEDGGVISGNLNGKIFQSEIGYFIPWI